jgi:ferric-dicitrate binding protein FerR (iron transport regulator)
MRSRADEAIAFRAADWLARLDQSRVPDGIHREFEAWCRADLRNLAAYLQVLDAWHRLDALSKDARRLASLS